MISAPVVLLPGKQGFTSRPFTRHRNDFWVHPCNLTRLRTSRDDMPIHALSPVRCYIIRFGDTYTRTLLLLRRRSVLLQSFGVKFKMIPSNNGLTIELLGEQHSLPSRAKPGLMIKKLR